MRSGKLITIDVNEETEAIAKKYFEKSGLWLVESN
jgi:predicted O-methyltransferase YrrM